MILQLKGSRKKRLNRVSIENKNSRAAHRTLSKVGIRYYTKMFINFAITLQLICQIMHSKVFCAVRIFRLCYLPHSIQIP